jgi:rubrerythrin
MMSKTKHWTLDDIDWSVLKPALVTAELLSAVKTAALVEANSADYVVYLNNVFKDDPEFCAVADRWGDEEIQHGEALGHWAELVDPSFNFKERLAQFRRLYRIPLEAEVSVRGSQSGELLARCVVESGTCSYYAALRDFSEDPVLRQICTFISRDESRHYRLFKLHAERYQKLNLLKRIKIAISRVAETSDDELGYAWHAATARLEDIGISYNREECAGTYNRIATSMYKRVHIDSAVHMVIAAIGLKARGIASKVLSNVIWRVFQAKKKSYPVSASSPLC